MLADKQGMAAGAADLPCGVDCPESIWSHFSRHWLAGRLSMTHSLAADTHTSKMFKTVQNCSTTEGVPQHLPVAALALV